MSFAKAEQLLELAGMVAASRMGVTLTDVEERFGCAHRTAQRMLAALERQDPDVSAAFDDEGRKRWRVTGGRPRQIRHPTVDEIAALDLAIAAIAREGSGPEASALRRLSDKVRSLVPPATMARLEADHEALLEAQGLLARPGPRPKIDEDVSSVVLEALKACRVLEIDYRSAKDPEPKSRCVMPYGVLTGARRYLVARPVDDPTGAIRTYRLDAVVAARLGKDGFARPRDFDLQAWANRSFGAYHDESQYGEVVWRFAPRAAERARGHVFHPDQILEDGPDGSLIVRFVASGHLEMAWHLYTWGDAVEVLSPPTLKAMVEGYRRSDFPSLP